MGVAAVAAAALAGAGQIVHDAELGVSPGVQCQAERPAQRFGAA